MKIAIPQEVALMNKILTIVLAVLLTVFVSSVAIGADHSYALAGQGFYGPSISPSVDPSEGSLIEHPATSEMTTSVADNSYALAGQGFYGPSISPSVDPSEGSLIESPSTSEMYFSSWDHPCVLGGQVLYGLSISPSDPSEGSLAGKQC